MHPKEVLTKLLKLIGVDIRQALIGSIVLGIVAAYGGLLYISKALLNYTLLFLTTSTPLWATISLVLLGCLYTYKKSRQEYPSTNSPSSDVVIDAVKTKILVLLVNKTDLMTSELISSAINLHIQTTTFHLEELAKLQMIVLTHGGWSNILANWSITQKGRLCLFKNNLLP